MLSSATPVPMTGPPHFVDLHVNPGESVSIQMLDGNETILRGPATITMVSQHSFPPVPMPVQVPPGHMVQQIVDENGTLRHIILSALNNSSPGSCGSTSTSSSNPPPILQVSQTNISQVSPHPPSQSLTGQQPLSNSSCNGINSSNNNSQQQTSQQTPHQPPSSTIIANQHPVSSVPSSSSNPVFSSPCCCSCCYCSTSSGVTTLPTAVGSIPPPHSSLPGHPLLGCFPAPMTLANGSLCPTPVLPSSTGSNSQGSNGGTSRRRTTSRNFYSYSKRSTNGSNSSTPNVQGINLNPLLSSSPNCSPVVSMSGLIPTAPPFILSNNNMNSSGQNSCSNNLSGTSSPASKSAKTSPHVNPSGLSHQLSPSSNEFHYIRSLSKNIILANNGPNSSVSNGRPTTSSSGRSSSSRQVPSGVDSESKTFLVTTGTTFSPQQQQQQQQSELISGHKVSVSVSDHLNKVSTSPVMMTNHVSVSNNHSMSSSCRTTSSTAASLSYTYKTSKGSNSLISHPNNNNSSNYSTSPNRQVNHGRQEVYTEGNLKNNNLSMNASSASSASFSPNSLDSSPYSEASSLDSSFSRSSSSSMNVTPLSSRQQLHRHPNGSVSMTAGVTTNGSLSSVNNTSSTRKSSNSSVSSSASSSPPTNGSLLANNLSNTSAPSSPSSLTSRCKKSRKEDKKFNSSVIEHYTNSDSARESCPENLREVHRSHHHHQHSLIKQLSNKQQSNSTSSSTLTVQSSSPVSLTLKSGSSASDSMHDLDDEDDVESQDNSKVCVTSMTITNQSHIEPYEGFNRTRILSSSPLKSHSSPNSPLMVVNNSSQHRHETNNSYDVCKNQSLDSSSLHLQSLSLSSSPIKANNKKNRSDFSPHHVSSSSSSSSVLVVESSAAMTTTSLRKKTKEGLPVNHASMSSKLTSSSQKQQQVLEDEVSSSFIASPKLTKKQTKAVNNEQNNSLQDDKSCSSRRNKKSINEDSSNSRSSTSVAGETSSSSSATSTPSKKNTQHVSRSVKSDCSPQVALHVGSTSASVAELLTAKESSETTVHSACKGINNEDGRTRQRLRREVTSGHKHQGSNDYQDHDEDGHEKKRVSSEEASSSKKERIRTASSSPSLSKHNKISRETQDNDDEESDTSSSSSLEVKKEAIPKASLLSLPEYQLLNITYTSLTATSVKLKWNLVSGIDSHSEDQHQVLLLLQQKKSAAGGFFTQIHFKVEMIESRTAVSTISTPEVTLSSHPEETKNLNCKESDDSCLPSELSATPVSASSSTANINVRNVYQGNSNTCRVSRLTCGQEYSFRVRTFVDSCHCVSNLLTITTPDQTLISKSGKQHKSKGSSCSANGSPASSSLTSSLHDNSSHRHDLKKNKTVSIRHLNEDDPVNDFENEKEDQRRAVMILAIFTLSALIIAIVIQQFLGNTFDSVPASLVETPPGVPVAPLPPPPVPSLPYPPV